MASKLTYEDLWNLANNPPDYSAQQLVVSPACFKQMVKEGYIDESGKLLKKERDHA
jgi:hypothetical protein